MVWKPIQNEAADLFGFIENFNFDRREYIRLLNMFNRARSNIDVFPAGEKGRNLINKVACDWLNHECKKHGVDHFSLNQSTPTQPWHQNFPVRQRNQLYIGRISINIDIDIGHI